MKKNLFLSVAALATLCIVGAKNLIHIEKEVEHPVLKEERGLVLPDVEGVKVVASNQKPKAGEIVIIRVTTENALARRVDAVKLNGKELKGDKSSQENTTIYSFVMPSDEIALVDIVAVDVFEVKVAEEVKDAFTVYGIENNVAAAGEVVEFRPSTYAGYFFLGVAAVDEDVVVEQMEAKPGWYSFTMPEHDVTLTSEVGKNIYKLSFGDNKVMVGDTEMAVWSLSGVTNDKYHEFGENIRFRVYNDSAGRYNLTTVCLENKTLIPGENDYYEFAMPNYNASVKINYEYIFRSMTSVDNSDRLNVTYKTVLDGEEVDVAENTLVKGNEVRAYVTRGEGVDEHIVPTFAFKGANGEADLSSLSSVSMDYNVDGDYYFFTMPGYDCIEVTMGDRYGVNASDAVFGEYEGGVRSNYSTSYGAKISSEFRYENNGGSFSNAGLIDFVTEGDCTHLKVGAKDLFFDGVDTGLYVDSNEKAGLRFFSKGHGKVVSTYGYILLTDSSWSAKSKQQFISATFEDETTKTVFYDFTTNEVKFNVSTIVNGTNGQTLNDEVEILDDQENLLACYKVTKVQVQNNGFQHEVSAIAIDELRGTYSPVDAEAGTEALVVNGHGFVTIGENQFPYHVDNGVFVVGEGESEQYFRLNVEEKTYAHSAAPTDALEGTYDGGDLGTLVLDGYGVLTLDGVEGTYEKINSEYIKVSINGSKTTFELNKENNTFTEPEYMIDASAEYTFVEDAEGNLISNNYYQHSKSAIYKIQAFKDLVVKFKYTISSENSDKFSVTKTSVNGTSTTIVSPIGGTIAETSMKVELKNGETLTFTYAKDSSVNNGLDQVTIKDLLIADPSTISDELEGTYVGTINGTSISMTLNGFGVATIDGSDYSYTRKVGEYIALNMGEDEHFIQLNRTTFTFETVNSYSIVKGNYTFINDNGVLTSNNYHVKSSSASITITVLETTTVSFTYSVSSESGYDGLSIKKNGEVLLNHKDKTLGSGTVAETEFSVTLEAGDVLEIAYIKDSGTDSGADQAVLKNFLINGVVDSNL